LPHKLYSKAMALLRRNSLGDREVGKYDSE
jgi:hypothetical protein